MRKDLIIYLCVMDKLRNDWTDFKNYFVNRKLTYTVMYYGMGIMVYFQKTNDIKITIVFVLGFK